MVLTAEEVAAFAADGYVAIRGAVAAPVAAACREGIWEELGRRGIRRDDRATWTAPVVRILCPEGAAFAEAGTGALIREACDQLLGAGRWWQRPGVGGTVPVRFPGEGDPGDAGWHIESSYSRGGVPWVNVRSRGRGLLALYLFSDVDADSAPTRLRPGSHRDVPALLAPAGDGGMAWREAARLAAEASAGRRTALATGAAGDVFLCHPFLVHAASWPHRGKEPRMLAQPAVTLHGEYRLGGVPAGEAGPVEQAIADCLPAGTAAR
jgi:hypothetical protein